VNDDQPVSFGYRDLPDDAGAARAWWDANADEYLDEHRDFLGDAGFRWGPEGLTEAEAGLLGDVDGRDVLEVGAGAAHCSRWLASRGARAVATDYSAGMLAGAARLDAATGVVVPRVQADARALPFACTGRSPACCARAAAGCSPSPTPCGGLSPTTRPCAA
jgi:SAM-dependent methyltransferase